MNEIEADFSINTPLFMSGADQTQAELRIASIKGAIRFWWRALNYAQFGGNIQNMKEMEDHLFGSTKGQAAIRFTLIKSFMKQPTQKGETLASARERLGARYLAYGLMDTFDGDKTEAGSLIRPCFEQGNFTIKLLSNYRVKSDDFNSVIEAVKLFGLLGNLGSRARKGYGSVTLLSLRRSGEQAWKAPSNQNEYIEKVQTLLKPTASFDALPSISALSNRANISLLQEDSRAMDLLGHYGLMMLRYRSWGRNEKIFDNVTRTNFNSEKRFEDDHDWYRESWFKSRNPDFHPERVIFGLPHNYSDEKDFCVKPTQYERRASPLFFHIHQYAKNSYVGIALILESIFLPENKIEKTGQETRYEEIEAGHGNNVEDQTDYQWLHQFLSSYEIENGRETQDAYFPDRQPIWPLPTVEEQS